MDRELASELEPLDGKRPLWLHDRHPDDRHVAMSIAGVEDEAQAAVWDAKTGKLVFRPERAVAICWLRRGREIALVSEAYNGILERRSWPGTEPLGACEVAHKEGWVDRIAAAPKGSLVAVRWIDQTEAGFELFELRDGGLRQLKGSGYRTGETNLLEGPVFSPSGRFVVVSEGRFAWWRRDEDDPDEPSEGGRFQCGWATILDTRSFSARRIPIEAEVSEGWLPEDEQAQLGLIGLPRFVSARSFVVPLPTGEDRRLAT